MAKVPQWVEIIELRMDLNKQNSENSDLSKEWDFTKSMCDLTKKAFDLTKNVSWPTKNVI